MAPRYYNKVEEMVSFNEIKDRIIEETDKLRRPEDRGKGKPASTLKALENSIGFYNDLKAELKVSRERARELLNEGRPLLCTYSLTTD